MQYLENNTQTIDFFHGDALSFIIEEYSSIKVWNIQKRMLTTKTS